jgi:hypothetical protein
VQYERLILLDDTNGNIIYNNPKPMKPKVKPVAKKATKQTWRPLGEYEEVYKGDILKTNPNISY